MAFLYPIVPLPGAVSWNRHRFQGSCESARLLATPEAALGQLVILQTAYDQIASFSVPLTDIRAQYSKIQQLRVQYSWRIGSL